jgi:hypothetical protein
MEENTTPEAPLGERGGVTPMLLVIGVIILGISGAFALFVCYRSMAVLFLAVPHGTQIGRVVATNAASFTLGVLDWAACCGLWLRERWGLNLARTMFGLQAALTFIVTIKSTAVGPAVIGSFYLGVCLLLLACFLTDAAARRFDRGSPIL